MVFKRVAAEECDVEAALGMAAVGHHQPEGTRIEIDHRFEVEGIEANVAKLCIGQGVHRYSPERANLAGGAASWGGSRVAGNAPPHAEKHRPEREKPEFGLDFLLL